MKKITKAVIPAAGYGTRFLPITKSLAKEMLPIIDTPAIEYIVREAIESKIEQFIIVVSGNKNAIIDYFDRNLELETILERSNKTKELEMIKELPHKVNVFFVRQKEQLGLGHAVLCAHEFIGEDDFALLLGDDVYVGNDSPALLQLINEYDKTNKSIIGTLKVPMKDTCKFGVCEYIDASSKERLNKLKDVVEKPKVEDAPSDNVIGGRYILTNTIFKYLKDQVTGAGGEIQLTDAIKRMMKEEDVYSYEIDGVRYDVGSKIGYIDAILDFALSRDDLKDEVKVLLQKKLK
ncbi:MAG: UTP--glucose-1-phosphate uridylyltransferase [bacterium]